MHPHPAHLLRYTVHRPLSLSRRWPMTITTRSLTLLLMLSLLRRVRRNPILYRIVTLSLLRRSMTLFGLLSIISIPSCRLVRGAHAGRTWFGGLSMRFIGWVAGGARWDTVDTGSRGILVLSIERLSGRTVFAGMMGCVGRVGLREGGSLVLGSGWALLALYRVWLLGDLSLRVLWVHVRRLLLLRVLLIVPRRGCWWDVSIYLSVGIQTRSKSTYTAAAWVVVPCASPHTASSLD